MTSLAVSISDVLRSVNTERIRFFDKSALSGKDLALRSIGGDLTNADIDQMLVENGLITQEQAETGRSNMPAATGNITIPPNTPGTYTEPGTGPVRQRQFGSQTAQRSDALHDEYLREHSA